MRLLGRHHLPRNANMELPQSSSLRVWYISMSLGSSRLELTSYAINDAASRGFPSLVQQADGGRRQETEDYLNCKSSWTSGSLTCGNKYRRDYLFVGARQSW